MCKPRLRELCITQAMEDGVGGRGAAGDAACGWEEDGDSTQHAVPDATTGRLVFATTGRATLEEQANNQRRPAPQRPSPYRAQRAGVSYEIKSPPKPERAKVLTFDLTKPLILLDIATLRKAGITCLRGWG